MDKNTGISERISQILDFYEINRNDFAKKLKYKRAQSVYDIINGKSKPSFDFFQKFFNSEYSEKINKDWLFTGKGDMILSANLSPIMSSNQKNTANEEPVIYKSRTDRLIEEQRIPLYDMETTLGMLPMYDDINSITPVDYLYIPNAPKCDGAMVGTGDSMYPIIKSGDKICYKIIHDIRNDVYFGLPYILYIQTHDDVIRTTKYVKKGKDENHYLLVSQNKHHDDKEIHISKIKAMAQVKMAIREF